MVDQRCPLPRGKGYGGTTLINGLAYVRGNPIDYERWEAIGNPGWGYDAVLPYFKKSEDFHKTDDLATVDYDYHGEGGYLNVEYHAPRSPHLEAFLAGNQLMGYNQTDYNSPQEIGCSPAQLNTKHGRRHDGGTAFIDPVKDRPNLTLLTNSYAIKIEIDPESKRATGVLFARGNKLYRVKANLEVIVCAGAFQSPHLLMHSGIGPSSHLESLGIPVILDLEVGTTLRDQSQYYGLVFSSNVSVPKYTQQQQIRMFVDGNGPLAINGPNEGLGFIQTSYETIPNYPDIEYLITPPVATSPYYQRLFRWNNQTLDEVYGGINANLYSSFVMYLINLHQESVGTVRLKSSSPYDYPLIDTNFLSDPKGRDIGTLYEGIQYILKLIETEPFRKMNTRLQTKPLSACSKHRTYSKAYWYCALRQLTVNVYHPMSTCSMGPDPAAGAVVDYRGIVHGMQNLRVADASVIPLTTSGHPNAVCVLIGEKISDQIKSDYGCLDEK